MTVDGHATHKSKPVGRFVEHHADRIELFFLPPYSPELNPDGLAWTHLKTKITKISAQSKDELKAAVERAMHQLRKMPKIYMYIDL
jgi:transposase